MAATLAGVERQSADAALGPGSTKKTGSVQPRTSLNAAGARAIPR
jgi:hypothetical protein